MSVVATMPPQDNAQAAESVASDGDWPVEDRVDALCRRPILVVGSPRGGTTWVQRLLLSDDRVCGGQETHFFNAFWPAVDVCRDGMKSTRGVGMLGHWGADELREAIFDLWRRTLAPVVRAAPATARVLVEKTPNHATVLGSALSLLPEAKVIHVIRDSRAVAASMLAAAGGWGKSWAPTSADEAARVWHRHTRGAMDAGRRLPPDRYLEVFYEDLLADPAAGVARLFAFAGLPIPPDRAREIAAAQQFEAVKETGGKPLASAAGAGAPEPAGFFRKGTPDAWRADLTLRQKLTVWRYTRKLMRQLGYGWKGRAPSGA